MDFFSGGYEIVNYYLLKGETGTDHALLYEIIKFEQTTGSFSNFVMEHKIFWLDLPQNPANKILKVFADNILSKYDPYLRNDYTILSCIPPEFTNKPEEKFEIKQKMPITFILTNSVFTEPNIVLSHEYDGKYNKLTPLQNKIGKEKRGISWIKILKDIKIKNLDDFKTMFTADGENQLLFKGVKRILKGVFNDTKSNEGAMDRYDQLMNYLDI